MNEFLSDLKELYQKHGIERVTLHNVVLPDGEVWLVCLDDDGWWCELRADQTPFR